MKKKRFSVEQITSVPQQVALVMKVPWHRGGRAGIVAIAPYLSLSRRPVPVSRHPGASWRQD